MTQIIKEYIIQGMHCGSCAVSIEMLLANQPGVKSAKVKFDDKKAVVEFDDFGKFNFNKVEKIINQMSYSISEIKYD